MANYFGNGNNNSYPGTGSNDVIFGFGGNDNLSRNGGDDLSVVAMATITFTGGGRYQPLYYRKFTHYSPVSDRAGAGSHRLSSFFTRTSSLSFSRAPFSRIMAFLDSTRRKPFFHASLEYYPGIQ